MAQITQYELIPDADRRLADEFITSLSVSVKNQTTSSYKNSLGFFYLCLDNVEISQARKARRKHIISWLKELSERCYAPSTVLHHIFHVRIYLSWLHENKHSRKNPIDLILPSDFPRLPKKLPRPLPPEVDKKLIEYLDESEDIKDKCLLLMRYTGLRLSDLLNLENKPIFEDNKGNSYLRVISPKFDKQYSLPIDGKTIELVSTLRNQTTDNLDGRVPHLLVSDPKGRKIGHVLRERLKAISPLVSDNPITPHQLRHTYATSMINAGMGLYSVMKLLGHMDMRMTLRYAELYPETLHGEYHSALDNIKQKYQVPHPSSSGEAFNPVHALEDINRWLRSSTKLNDQKGLAIIKRISRLKADVVVLIKSHDSVS